MFLIAPVDNNRWVYAMHGLEKPMDHVSGNDLSMYLGIGKKHQCRRMFQDSKYF